MPDILSFFFIWFPIVCIWNQFEIIWNHILFLFCLCLQINSDSLFDMHACLPFNDQCSHHIETSQLICRTNQLAGFYMIGTLVIKGLSLLIQRLTSLWLLATSQFKETRLYKTPPPILPLKKKIYIYNNNINPHPPPPRNYVFYQIIHPCPTLLNPLVQSLL